MEAKTTFERLLTSSIESSYDSEHVTNLAQWITSELDEMDEPFYQFIIQSLLDRDDGGALEGMAWDLMGALLATFDNPERADEASRRLTYRALTLMATRCSPRDAFTLLIEQLGQYGDSQAEATLLVTLVQLIGMVMRRVPADAPSIGMRLRQCRAVLPLLSHYAIDQQSLFAALDRQKAVNEQQVADRKRIRAQRAALKAKALTIASSSSSDTKRAAPKTVPPPSSAAAAAGAGESSEDEEGDADAWKAANFTADQYVSLLRCLSSFVPPFIERMAATSLPATAGSDAKLLDQLAEERHLYIGFLLSILDHQVTLPYHQRTAQTHEDLESTIHSLRQLMTASGITTLDLARPNDAGQPSVDILNGWSVTGRAVYFYLTLVQTSATDAKEATLRETSLLSILAPFATSLLSRVNDALSLSLGEKFASHIIQHYAPPSLPMDVLSLSMSYHALFGQLSSAITLVSDSKEVGATADVQHRFLSLWTPAAQWTLFTTAMEPPSITASSSAAPSTAAAANPSLSLSSLLSSAAASSAAASITNSSESAATAASISLAASSSSVSSDTKTVSTSIATNDGSNDDDDGIPDEEIEAAITVEAAPQLRTLAASVRASILFQLRQKFGDEHKAATTSFGNSEHILQLLARLLVYYVPDSVTVEKLCDEAAVISAALALFGVIITAQPTLPAIDDFRTQVRPLRSRGERLLGEIKTKLAALSSHDPDDLRSRNDITRYRTQQPAITRITAALIKAIP